jgi:hypothetical protein
LTIGTSTATTKLSSEGELNLYSSVLEECKRELKKANEGKVGEPYQYPESYIRLLAFIRLLFHQPYRQTEGFVHFLSKFVDGLQVPDYSTINRRVKRVLGDYAYSRANFNFLTQEGIKPVIRVRKGSVPRSRGSQARKLAVIE